MSRADRLSRRAATCGILTSLALCVSLLESVIPIQALVPLPGIKLGFANIVVLFALYRLGIGDAVIISLLRVCLSSLLFGSVTSFFFSLSGALLSLAVAILIKLFAEKVFSFVGLSVLCAAAHNTGQIIAACVTLGSPAPLSYLSLLLWASLLTGAITGCILQAVEPKIKI